MDIGSSNYFSVSASTNKGMSGMISGMDTESMVKQMLSGTQSKIDKQTGLQTQTEWKQEIYRDLITTISGFQNKYFDTSFGASLSTNFSNSSFFNTMLSKVSGDNTLKVLSTDSSASVGDIEVIVKKLAANASIKSDQRISGNELKIEGGAITSDTLKSFEKKMSFNVTYRDSTDNSLKKKSVELNLNNVTTEKDMLETFNSALTKAGLGDQVQAKIQDGRLRIVGGVDNNISDIGGTPLALKMTGLSNAYYSEIKDSNDVTTGKMYQGGQVLPATGMSFDMNLDGVTKKITINAAGAADGTVTMDSLGDALAKEVKRAFGDNIMVERVTDPTDATKTVSFNLKLNVGSPPELGHQLTITGADAAKIGITPGSSTSLSSSTKLKDLANKMSGVSIQGDRYSFEINGEEFSFSQYDSVSTMMNTINNSNAGVRMSYSAVSDTFSLESTSTGSKYGVNVKQTEGNLLSVILDDNIEAGTSVTGKEITTGEVKGNAGGLATSYTTSNGSMTINVDGKNEVWTLDYKRDSKGKIKVDKDGKPLTYTKEEIEKEFNTWLSEKFNHVKMKADGTPDLDADGKEQKEADITYADGKLTTAPGYEHAIRFTQSKIDQEDADAVKDAIQSDLALAFGFNKNNNTNVATGSTQISSLRGMDGVTFLKADGTNATTLDEVAKIDGMDVKFSDGRFSITGTSTTGLSEELKKVFGFSNFSTGTGAETKKMGQDAELRINGTDTTRSSNTFTVDGVTMQATGVTTNSGTADAPIYNTKTVITTERDTDKIVDGFKSFVEDYNKMLEKINGLLDEKSSYKSYPPLTSEQKKEMSDNEIELWEKKAKEGLLRRDSTLDSFLTSMRGIMYTKPEGAKLALFDIGIETGQYKNKGKLEFNETTLRSALAADPDSVTKLFTAAGDGLSAQMMKTLKATVNPSSANPGSLVQIAGMEGWGSEKNNNLTLSIESIKSKIQDLQTKYEKERKRYWNQFNSMEKILANFNSQSSFLGQQFGG